MAGGRVQEAEIKTKTIAKTKGEVKWPVKAKATFKGRWLLEKAGWGSRKGQRAVYFREFLFFNSSYYILNTINNNFS